MSEKHGEWDHVALARLKAIHTHLEVVYAGIVVVTAALRHQGAEQDEEFAMVLQSLVADRLGEQINQLNSVVRSWNQRSGVRDCALKTYICRGPLVSGRGTLSPGGKADSATGFRFGAEASAEATRLYAGSAGLGMSG